MANPEHVEILKQGRDVWNRWREEHREIRVLDLSGAHLRGANLRGADLSGARLGGAGLSRADLSGADLNGARLGGAALIKADLIDAHLRETDLIDAILINADLSNADLSGANLGDARFNNTNLNGANLRGVDLINADLSRSQLNGADFTTSTMGNTKLADLDLSGTKGLETVRHVFPSTIGIDTLYKSAGKIPETFLRGCGVPDDFITFIPSHFGIRQAINFYSCFIIYSTKDEEFARRLYSRMRDEKLRVWFAPEDIKGGQKLQEQIERAIQLHDRLLIVLSEDSMRSDWGITEIQKARETEIKEDRRKLFPITIVNFEKVKAWNRFDADTGRDLAKEVREYYIPDFSKWKDHDAFEKAFDRLLRDLKAEDRQAAEG